jgi:alkylation response protein AidB-like acyl-CoA dehydrogenase
MATKLIGCPRAAQRGDARRGRVAPDAEALCNMAKTFASVEILQVCRHAMELHGGNGVAPDLRSRSCCAALPFSCTGMQPLTSRASKS